MSSRRGGKREGAGRPKGSRNRYNAEMEKLLQAHMDELGHENYDPVIAMAEIALNEENPIDLRFKAHAEVAQYIRTKCRSLVVTQSTNNNAEQQPQEARSHRIKELSKACGYT